MRTRLWLAALTVATPSCGIFESSPQGEPLTFEVRDINWIPNPQIWLIVSGEREYSCLGYHLEGDLQVRDRSIRLALSGEITPPTGVCLPAVGPAEFRAPLPIADGVYLLEFARGGATDRYRLTVTDAAIWIRPLGTSFTRPTVLHFPRGD
jgi:hypothetical protein